MCRRTLYLVLALAALALFAMPLEAMAQQLSDGRQDAGSDRPANIILMIADGTGPATITMARDYTRDILDGRELALDGILVGSARTRSTSSRVTDSAAGATAYAAGVKTYNGAISVDTLRRPVGTVLEAAEARGMATGLVATSRLTHATPAAFAAHVPDRGMETEIAAQMIEQGADVLFGGGRDQFLQESAGGAREDGRNLLDAARAAGYQVIDSRDAFDGSLRTPVLGLFTMSHMAFEIDRDSLAEPSLAEMTRRALDLLDEDPDGFFLMVEGSRIDHAAHANDAAAHVQDMLAYDAAVAAALDFARRDGRTLVVSVADHETGGLSLGRAVDGQSIYDWATDVIARITASYDVIIPDLMMGQNDPAAVLERYTGIDDLTAEERERIIEAAEGTYRLQTVLGDIIGQRAVIGWTTGGHTAVDVNLYAFGPGHQLFVGNHENNYVGRTIANLLQLDLEAATAAARAEHASH